MATTTYTNITIAQDTWTELVALQAGLSGVRSYVQNRSNNAIRIFWGGASAPTAQSDGWVLERGDIMPGTNTKIWVRSDGLPATITVGIAD